MDVIRYTCQQLKDLRECKTPVNVTLNIKVRKALAMHRHQAPLPEKDPNTIVIWVGNDVKRKSKVKTKKPLSKRPAKFIKTDTASIVKVLNQCTVDTASEKAKDLVNQWKGADMEENARFLFNFMLNQNSFPAMWAEMWGIFFTVADLRSAFVNCTNETLTLAIPAAPEEACVDHHQALFFVLCEMRVRKLVPLTVMYRVFAICTQYFCHFHQAWKQVYDVVQMHVRDVDLVPFFENKQNQVSLDNAEAMKAFLIAAQAKEQSDACAAFALKQCQITVQGLGVILQAIHGACLTQALFCLYERLAQEPTLVKEAFLACKSRPRQLDPAVMAKYKDLSLERQNDKSIPPRVRFMFMDMAEFCVKHQF